MRYQTLLQIEGSGFKRFRSHKLLLSVRWKGFSGSAASVSLVTVGVRKQPESGASLGEQRSEFILSVPAPVCFCSPDFKASLKHFRSSHWCLLFFLLFSHIFFFLSQSQPEEMCLPWSSRKNILTKWPSPKTRSGVCIDCIDKHNQQFWCSGPDNVSNALYLF